MVGATIELFLDCQKESPWWMCPQRELAGSFSRGGEIKSFSNRQFHNPLMYSGVLIHAAWTVSSEGLGVRSRNSHGRGVPIEEVFRAAMLCPGFLGVDESPALHHHCPVGYWYREPSGGPWAIAKGKEVICVPSRSYMGQ